MKTNKFGEIIYSENDLFSRIMEGIEVSAFKNAVVDFDPIEPSEFIDESVMASFQQPANDSLSIKEFDAQCQAHMHMPDIYKNLDIAEYLLSKCTTQDQLQRVGVELLMFQQRNMLELLCYMKYLVDTMQERNIIWGLGRGSSVASYALYLLGVHRVDSIHYNLDIQEFLR